MIKPEDFTGTNYIEILGIKEKVIRFLLSTKKGTTQLLRQ